MPRNIYFSEGAKNEQSLYEDLIIEALRIYGTEVFYLPRTIVSRDTILNEDDASRFDDAYQIEMYIENVAGFEGEGLLMSKFGIELRDQATFVVSKRRWKQYVGDHGKGSLRVTTPSEGDLIYLPMSKSFFEIRQVEAQRPFYQLKNLPTYRMQCELFEYNDEDFDTSIKDIDDIERKYSTRWLITLDIGSGESNTFRIGEIVRQASVASGGVTEGYTIAEVVAKTATTIEVVGIKTTGEDDGVFNIGANPLVGDTSNTSLLISAIAVVEPAGGQNKEFQDVGNNLIDFTEQNPFGEP